MITDGNKLYMVKGDTESFNVYKKNALGAIVPFVAGDTVYFTVSASPLDTAFIFQKVITSFTQDGKAVVNITHNDTKDVDLTGVYTKLYYDVQVDTASTSAKKTIIKPTEFYLMWEVTHD